VVLGVALMQGEDAGVLLHRVLDDRRLMVQTFRMSDDCSLPMIASSRSGVVYRKAVKEID